MFKHFFVKIYDYFELTKIMCKVSFFNEEG